MQILVQLRDVVLDAVPRRDGDKGRRVVSGAPIGGDPRMQGYLTMWRTMLPGGVEIDVFKDVEP